MTRSEPDILRGETPFSCRNDPASGERIPQEMQPVLPEIGVGPAEDARDAEAVALHGRRARCREGLEEILDLAERAARRSGVARQPGRRPPPEQLCLTGTPVACSGRPSGVGDARFAGRGLRDFVQQPGPEIAHPWVAASTSRVDEPVATPGAKVRRRLAEA